MKKRIMSLLLAVLMVAGLQPTTVLAATVRMDGTMSEENYPYFAMTK